MRTLKVSFACLFGAFVGSLVALQLSSPVVALVAWPVIGFIVGYLSYEYRKVGKAIVKAFREVYAWPWRPNFPAMADTIVLYLRSLLAFFIFLITVAASHLLVLITVVLYFTSSLELHSLEIAISAITGGVIFATPFAALGFYGSLEKKKEEEEIKGLWKASWNGNLVAAYCYWLPRGIVWVAKRTPTFVAKARTFAKVVFVEIHSDIRLLCGVDAAIGAGIGYFTGSAIIGALAGGIWGALNYYLISIKLLKLVPGQAGQ